MALQMHPAALVGAAGAALLQGNDVALVADALCQGLVVDAACEALLADSNTACQEVCAGAACDDALDDAACQDAAAGPFFAQDGGEVADVAVAPAVCQDECAESVVDAKSQVLAEAECYAHADVEWNAHAEAGLETDMQADAAAGEAVQTLVWQWPPALGMAKVTVAAAQDLGAVVAEAKSRQVLHVGYLTAEAIQGEAAAVQAEVCWQRMQMHATDEQGTDADLDADAAAFAAEHLPAGCHACLVPAVAGEGNVGELVDALQSAQVFSCHVPVGGQAMWHMSLADSQQSELGVGASGDTQVGVMLTVQLRHLVTSGELVLDAVHTPVLLAGGHATLAEHAVHAEAALMHAGTSFAGHQHDHEAMPQHDQQLVQQQRQQV